jgi:hypothetical protein
VWRRDFERPSPVNTGVTFSQLKLWNERDRKAHQITASLAPRLFALPGVMAFPINPPSLGPELPQPAAAVRRAGKLVRWRSTRMVTKLIAKARQSPAIANPDSDLRLNKPQLSVGHQTARRPLPSAWMSRPSAAPWRRCSGAGRSPASSAKESNTTWSCSSRQRTATSPRT